MESTQLAEDCDKIYIIARVYYLGKPEMGVKLYVDPASLRQKGKLIFRADKYSVVPGGD